jgi:hypothetical protein
LIVILVFEGLQNDGAASERTFALEIETMDLVASENIIVIQASEKPQTGAVATYRPHLRSKWGGGRAVIHCLGRVGCSDHIFGEILGGKKEGRRIDRVRSYHRINDQFSDYSRGKQIFTSFEFDRKVPLMFTLNIMCTFMTGYFQRNNRVRKFLEERASSFPERDEVISAMNKAGAYINSMNLPDGSMWWNKANFFSLVSELSRLPETMKQSPQDAKQKLLSFADRVPSDYALAAREAVGQKAERELRGKVVRTLLLSRLASTK